MRADSDPGHIDFLALSAHKMYAPYGSGALIGPTALFAEGTPDLVGGGTVDIVTENDVRWTHPPDRDEAGSPNVVGAVALAQAVLSLQEIGMDALARHETELTAYTLRRLQEIEEVELYGLTDPERAGERLGVIPLNVRGIDHYKVAAVLSLEGAIGVRNGCFCAHPYILRLLKVPAEQALRHQADIVSGSRASLPGLVRISFGCYNTAEEVDQMVDVLGRLVRGQVGSQYDQDPASGAYWPRGYEPNYEPYLTLKPGMMAKRRAKGASRCGV